jgi:hypothetical protein
MRSLVRHPLLGLVVSAAILHAAPAFADASKPRYMRADTADKVLAPGDILVKVSGKEMHLTAKIIQTYQKLIRAIEKPFRSDLAAGDPRAFHALIYLGGGRTAEAYGGSLDTAKVAMRTLDAQDGYAFLGYRSKDAGLRKRAIEVATRWATGAMKYKVPVNTGFHTVSFGHYARKEALRFVQGALRTGGPEGFDKMFCSEFVIAVYQAAALLPAYTANPKLKAKELSLPPSLQIHASNATPITLQGHLQRAVDDPRDRSWEFLGTVAVSLEAPEALPPLTVAPGPDVTAKLVRLGNPTKARFASGDAVYARNPWSLVVFDGKLYVASGNSNHKGPAPNTGPVDLWTARLGESGAKWVREYEVADEQVDLFRIFDGELWIPGHDSHVTGRNPSWLKKVLGFVKDWAAGNVYRHRAGGDRWEQLRTIPNGIHVYDLLRFGGKLFAAISTIVGGVVAASSDGGLRWELMLTDFGPGHRTRSLFALGGALYASTTAGKVYRFDAAKKKFDHLDVELFPNRLSGELFAARTTAFGDRVVYIGARTQIDHDWDPMGLFVVEAPLSARLVDLPGGAMPRDVLVEGKTLYVLASRDQAGGGTQMFVFKSEDLKSWESVLHFESGTFARSFAKNAGSFFFGLGSNPTDLRPGTGEILEVPAAACGGK